jgi:hypothetical protein
LLPRDEIERVDIQNWPKRTGVDVRITATQWDALTTKKARKELFASTGVRGSSLHRLAYRDHVRHTVLGVMHNWPAGVLQTTARQFWGIGVHRKSSAEDADDMDDHDESDSASEHAESYYPPADDLIDIDDDMLLDLELSSLTLESQQHADTPAHPGRLRSREPSAASVFPADDNPEDIDPDGDYVMADNESDGDTIGDTDGAPARSAHRASQSIFDPTEMKRIWDCIADIARPTWMEPPPKNLGQPSHGKLKADLWLTLFTIDLLTCLPEIWCSEGQQHLLLANFFDLVVCTNIACAFSTSPSRADSFTEHFTRFRSQSQTLFPSYASVPNFHYAMHIGDLLKFWGPLMAVSEWAYERDNGMLQRVKTNAHLCMSVPGFRSSKTY